MDFPDQSANNQATIDKIGIEMWAALKIAQFKEGVSGIELLILIQEGRLPIAAAIEALQQSLENQEIEFIAAGADPAWLDLVRK